MRNGQIDLGSWQQKLHFQVEVRETRIDMMKVRVVRFGDSISVGSSPEIRVCNDYRIEASTAVRFYYTLLKCKNKV